MGLFSEDKFIIVDNRSVSEQFFYKNFSDWVGHLQCLDYEFTHLDKSKTDAENLQHLTRFYNAWIKPAWKQMQLGIDRNQRK